MFSQKYLNIILIIIYIGSFQVQSQCSLNVDRNKNAADGEKFHLKTQAGEYLIGMYKVIYFLNCLKVDFGPQKYFCHPRNYLCDNFL